MKSNGQRRLCFFAGPTLSATAIRDSLAGLDAAVEICPPIQQGDLLRRMNDLPDVIAIIDGYFYQVPAVQHKEVLLALEKGAQVLGAASLGALRAAELEPFGMEGIGQIYHLYKDGLIDGDDEVAVSHGPPESGFRSFTEPLINIRHALRLAQEGGIIAARTVRMLLNIARRIHFTERTYPTIFQAVQDRATCPNELAAFQNFIRCHRTDLKRADALTLVAVLAARLRGEEAWPVRRPITVHRTKYLHITQRDYAGHRAANGHHVPDSVILAFHKIFCNSFPELFRRVSLRCIAVEEALHENVAADRAETLLEVFRDSQGLRAENEFARWLENHYLSEQDLCLTLWERELERCLLLRYREKEPLSHDDDLYRAVLSATVARTGVSAEELMYPPFMQPGIAWEEPFVRELKWSGDFPEALGRAGRIIEFEEEIFGENTELKTTYAALLSYAREPVEGWIAQQWGIGREEIEEVLPRRGFVRYREFLEVARRAYAYAMRGPELH